MKFLFLSPLLSSILSAFLSKGPFSFVTSLSFCKESSLSLEEALKVYENWLAETESERVNKKIRIKENPGFPISFQKERIGKRYHIQIDQINHLEYIEYISLYIDVLLRVVLQMEKENKNINVLNKNKIEIKDHVKDVKSDVQEKTEEAKCFQMAQL